MGVCRNRVDFAADGLEFIVEVCQVLQLRGADEGKVGGVEEEHRPLAQDIGLGDRLECPLVVGLDAEIADFFLNHGHGYDPPLKTNEIMKLAKAN